jgi:prevent-host-death family protein
MYQVNIFQAKSELSRLIALLESKSEESIVIARNGKPVAKLVPMGKTDALQRIGVARGLFQAPDNLDIDNPVIAALFGIDQ